MTRHRLDPVRAAVVDVFDQDTPPVLEIDPGDTVVVDALDARGYLAPLETPGEEQPRMFPAGRGHCLAGPIAVRTAEPGTVLAVQLKSIRPGRWGWTVAAAKDTKLNRDLNVTGEPPAWLLWDIDPDRGTATDQLGHEVTIAPFLGVLGVAPAEPGEHRTMPPSTSFGGNIDCRDLVAGTTVYLPVTVPGALLHVGDGHAAQGDGEVAGTAVECPMTTEMTVDVLPGAPVPGIHAVTPAARVTFGFDEDLAVATTTALDAMVQWIQHSHGLSKTVALALAGAVVDLHVTQVVNETWGVHATLGHDAIRRPAGAGGSG
ncbi:acetamidase/formamidase family protein [Amycolatopsis jejuensis]|uniref:acetamidase/formamidase family protein n=1 Tax=Amycolatopsis jejuensis TaxID=330084 RepID=UPI000527DC40|nr:acetamidase/formamidase family protein [Amycolatopsis jejuensis]